MNESTTTRVTSAHETVTSAGALATAYWHLMVGLCTVPLAAAFAVAVYGASIAEVGGLIATLVVVAVWAWWTRRADARALGLLLAAYSLIIVGWAVVVRSQQTSDFGVYFRCGAEFWNRATIFRQWAHLCESGWLPGNPIYWRRALLYSLPIGAASSGRYLALTLYNALLHVAAVVALYRLVGARLGMRAGLIAAAVLAVYPEFWFATSLATSDNVAVLLVVAWLAFVLRAFERQDARFEVVGAAVIGVALDLTRDIGVICVLAVLILAAVAPRGRRFRWLALATLTLALTVATKLICDWLSLPGTYSPGLLARIAGYGLTSTHSWNDAYFWDQYIYPLLPSSGRDRYAIELIASDMQHGVLTALQNWLHKTGILFRGDGYYYFAGAPFDTNPDSYAIGGGPPPYNVNASMMSALTGVEGGFAIAALAGLLKLRDSQIAKPSFAFFAAFLFLVVGFAESQPRYSVLLSPVIAIFIAGIVLPRAESTIRLIGGAITDTAVSAAVLCIGFGVCAWALHAVLGRTVPLSLVGQEHPNAIGVATCNVEKAEIALDGRYVLFHLPATRPACYSFLLDLSGIEVPVHAFVTRYPVIPRWQAPEQSAVHVSVLPVDDRVSRAIVGGGIDLGGAVAAEVALAPVGDKRVRLRLDVDADPRHRTHDVLFGFARDNEGNAIPLEQAQP